MITDRDRFQLAAFHTHYKINMRAGRERTESFVLAIAATSDQATDKVIRENPDIIEQWKSVSKKQICNGMLDGLT